MSRSFSLYLDLVRVVAALVVLLGHFAWSLLGGGLFWQLAPLGHVAVLVFFVLSGYVIAYSAETRERSLAAYGLDRAARLLSVVTPAVLLALLLDVIGGWANPGFYARIDAAPSWTAMGGHRLLEALAGQFLVNEIWWLHVPILGDGPFWSLGYEVWYYAIFGAAFYLRGAARIAAVAVACAIAGPKILFMMPIWLCGAAAWRFRDALPDRFARPVCAATLVALVVLTLPAVSGLFAPMHDLGWPLEYRPTDHLIGPLVALHFAAAARLGPLPGLARIGGWIRAAAGMTFSLYLYHLPILMFLGATLPGDPAQPGRRAALLGLTLALVAALAIVTERKKHLVRHALVAVGRRDRGASPAPPRSWARLALAERR